MNQSGLKFLLVFILLFASATSIAQLSAPGLSPKVVVYAGYSGYNPGGKSGGVEFGRLPHGWNTAAEVQFTPRYSFIADFGGYSRSTVGSTHTYLFGPKFTFHRGPFSPFAQVMMGFQRLSPKGSPSYIAFSEAIGAGLDVAIAHRWSVRLFQADFIYAADHEKGKLALNQFFGARVSAGLVWNFGKPRKPRESAGKKPTSAPASAEPIAEATKTETSTAAAEVTKTETAPATSDAPANSAAAAAAEPATMEAPKADSAPTAEAPAPATAANPTTAGPEPASTTPASQPEADPTPKSEPVSQSKSEKAEPAKQAAPAQQSEPAKLEEAKEPEVSVQPDNKPKAEPATAPEPPKAEAAPPAEATPAEKPVSEAAKSATTAQAATATLAQDVVEEKKTLRETKSGGEKTSAPKASTQPQMLSKATEPPATHASTTPPAVTTPTLAVKQIAIVNFPYDQYLTLLSAQDKRTLNAVASRLKLEPESKIVIVGNALRWEGPKTAAQRAVNAKDQLIQKGIAADRVQVFARPLPTSRRKYPPAKTEVLFVPAGATYDAASATPVDEQQVKPEHLHVAHPDWHEK